LQLLFAVVSNRKAKVVLQCEAGISRSPAFVTALMVWGMQLEWEDAVKFVKRKNSRTQINQELADQIIKVIKAMTN
jgi:protein-tyrosine phosphatase